MSYFTYTETPQVTKQSSVFATRPYTYNPVVYGTQWELLVEYSKRKFISRNQIRKLVRKKWLAVSSFKNRLYVSELCPEEIKEAFSE